MNRQMRRAAVAGFFGLLLGGAAQAAVGPGMQAPDFELLDEQGSARRLSDFRDQIVVLEWTNHDCPFVRKHYGSGNMQGLQKKYGAQGVAWLSIVSSAPGKQGHVSAEQARALSESRSASPTAVLLDPKGQTGRVYGAKTTPHMYVINKGQVAYAGAIDSIPSASQADIARADNYVTQALDSILAGDPVSTPSSRPYGCSVKY